MSQRDEIKPALGSPNPVVWPTAALASQAPQLAKEDTVGSQSGRDHAGGFISLEEAADEIGGLPEEIRVWIRSGAVVLADSAAALAGRISERDLGCIERHQVAVDIQRCVKDADKFLDTRFERFGDKTPRELLQQDDIDLVRDLVWQMKSGAI